MSEVEDLFRTLLGAPAETRARDNKGAMEWPPAKSESRFKLLADIMAFSNTRDGGTLVFGVENGTHALIGLTKVQVESFDKTKVYDALKAHASPIPDFEVERCQVDGRWYVAFLVRAFRELPTVCRQIAQVPAGNATKVMLRPGAIYVRTSGAQTMEITGEAEMRDLLELATQHKGEHLLRQIASLIPLELQSSRSAPDSDPYAGDEASARRELAF